MLSPNMRLDKVMALKELPEQVLVAHEMGAGTSAFGAVEVRHVIENRDVNLKQGGFFAGHEGFYVLLSCLII